MTSEVSEQFLTSGNGRLWLQKNGCINTWEYWGCYEVGDVSMPEGDVTLFHCPSPARAKAYQVAGSYQGAPGPVTTSIAVPRYIQTKLLQIKCPFNMMIRDTFCNRPDDPLGWEQILYLHRARFTSRGISAPVSREPDDEAPPEVTGDISAESWLELWPLTWQEQGTAALGMFTLNDVAFCDSPSCGDECGVGSEGCQVGWAVGDGGSPDDAPLLYTSDAGVTWADQGTPFSTGGDDITSVACAGDYVIITNGTTAEIAYSTDGGTTWTVVSTGFDGGAPLNDIYMYNRYNIWIVGAGGYVYYSNDGGVSWSVQEDGSVTTQELNKIHGFDDKVIFAVGDNGAILETTDGQTWSSVTAPTDMAGTEDVEAVFVVDRLTVFIGAVDAPPNRGGLWYSVDGGDSWTNVLDAFEVYDIKFCNYCNFGFLTTDGGDVYRTIDGGKTWTEEQTPADANLYAVWCCDPNTVYAVGDNGYIEYGHA